MSPKKKQGSSRNVIIMRSDRSHCKRKSGERSSSNRNDACQVACYDLIKPYILACTQYHVLELLNLLVDSCLCWVYVLDTNLFVNSPLVGLLSIQHKSKHHLRIRISTPSVYLLLLDKFHFSFTVWGSSQTVPSLYCYQLYVYRYSEPYSSIYFFVQQLCTC